MGGDGKQTLLGTLCNGLGVFCSSNTSNEPRAKTYQRAMNLTVITWMVYPIIWILAEGTGTISVEGENIAYTALDILSKSIFGWLIVFQNWHLGAVSHWQQQPVRSCKSPPGTTSIR